MVEMVEFCSKSGGVTKLLFDHMYVHEEYPKLREKLKRVGERDDAPPVWAFYKLLDFLNQGRFVTDPIPARPTTGGAKKKISEDWFVQAQTVVRS